MPDGVEITSITYGMLCNTGNYENERIELTAKVYKGECPNAIASSLKARAMNIMDVLGRLNKKDREKSPVDFADLGGHDNEYF